LGFRRSIEVFLVASGIPYLREAAPNCVQLCSSTTDHEATAPWLSCLYVGQVSKPAAHCGGYGKPPYSVPLTYQLDSQGPLRQANEWQIEQPCLQLFRTRHKYPSRAAAAKEVLRRHHRLHLLPVCTKS
jgi:hypothetical protein